MTRFTGTVQELGSVDVESVGEWLAGIAYEEWPQQHRLEDGGIRPAMVKDPEWHGFAEEVRTAIQSVMGRHFPGASVANTMLTVVMPGHSIPTHTDEQPPHWLCRVHAPLTTNDVSRFVVGAEAHHMEVGKVYLVNTEAEHSVANDGTTPRVHLMWDVHA